MSIYIYKITANKFLSLNTQNYSRLGNFTWAEFWFRNVRKKKLLYTQSGHNTTTLHAIKSAKPAYNKRERESLVVNGRREKKVDVKILFHFHFLERHLIELVSNKVKQAVTTTCDDWTCRQHGIYIRSPAQNNLHSN